MFKSIWKGIKWFFNVPDESKVKITRKHNHAHIPATDKGHPIKVRTPPTEAAISEIYEEMTRFRQDTNQEKMDGVEAAKSSLWIPHRIQHVHKEHILATCGFAKTHRQDGKSVYDPRLIQVINYAMNMYGVEVRSQIADILKDTEDKPVVLKD